MPSNKKEQFEHVANLLSHAQALLDHGDLTRPPSAADLFLPTLIATVDNDDLSDAEFRQFVRNALPGVLFPRDHQVVMTNVGPAYRVGGCWFRWNGATGTAVAIEDQNTITQWHALPGLPLL